MLAIHKNSRFNTILGLGLCSLVGLFALTSAPEAIAQQERRPVFDEVYDANAPKKFSGKIVRIDFAEFISYLHVDATNDDGSTTRWLIESGSFEDKHANGLDSNALFPGRPITVTGYQTLDKSCTPTCKLNGRDITFEDTKN